MAQGSSAPRLRITIGDKVLNAVVHVDQAPATWNALCSTLPLSSKVVHCRWSGEAFWIPLGDQRLPVGPENGTIHPLPGEIVVYPGGVSEMEVLISYGAAAFGSKAGPLVGNHFATITESREVVAEIGRAVLWEGAKPITIEADD